MKQLFAIIALLVGSVVSASATTLPLEPFGLDEPSTLHVAGRGGESGV